MAIKFFTICFLLITYLGNLPAQKVLQIERIGKAKTKKLYLGESIFIKTKQNRDIWFEAAIEDLIPTAQAIVFFDRIVQIDDIIAMKFRKKSAISNYGKTLQFSAVVPVGYEVIYGSINPPIEWESLAYIAGGAVVLGSLMRLIPPKKYKFGKRRRLRVLDLTFYSGI